MKRLTSSIAAAVLLAVPLPVLSHGAPNWKAVAWERNQNTPEGIRWATFVDTNSILRWGDVVAYQEDWQFINDKNLPVQKGRPLPPDYSTYEWIAVERRPAIRVLDCKTYEYLGGKVSRGADGKIQVKKLSQWVSIPAGPLREAANYVCRQR